MQSYFCKVNVCVYYTDQGPIIPRIDYILIHLSLLFSTSRVQDRNKLALILQRYNTISSKYEVNPSICSSQSDQVSLLIFCCKT